MILSNYQVPLLIEVVRRITENSLPAQSGQAVFFMNGAGRSLKLEKIDER
jgi:hypothetical protein